MYTPVGTLGRHIPLLFPVWEAYTTVIPCLGGIYPYIHPQGGIYSYIHPQGVIYRAILYPEGIPGLRRLSEASLTVISRVMRFSGASF